MADDADLAAEIADNLVAAGVRAARAPIATGTAGDCDNCGEFFGRLVGGRCGFCRDGRRPDYGRTLPLPVADDDDDHEDDETMGNPGVRSVTIQASGDLRRVIEERAAERGVAMGRVAQDLAEAALRQEQEGGLPDEPLVVPEPTTPRQQMVALLDGIAILLTAQIERAEVVDLEALAAATARAEVAEARLAQVKAAVGI